MRVVRDWGQYEIFANDGQVSHTATFAFTPTDGSVWVTGDGTLAVVSADFHPLNRAWPGKAAWAERDHRRQEPRCHVHRRMNANRTRGQLLWRLLSREPSSRIRSSRASREHGSSRVRPRERRSRQGRSLPRRNSSRPASTPTAPTECASFHQGGPCQRSAHPRSVVTGRRAALHRELLWSTTTSSGTVNL